MTAYEILIAAKALIPDADHWWRGGADLIRSGRDCECPVTAILRAGAHMSAEETAQHLFRDAIGGGSPGIWNDAKERTLSEVHAAFDRAIAAVAP
jgi:hypothetical protein